MLNHFRSAFELWGHGKTHSDLRTSLLNYPPENMVCQFKSCCITLLVFKKTNWKLTILMSVFPLPYLLLQLPFMQIGSTYRINVYTFNKTLEFAERIKRIDVCIYMCPIQCVSDKGRICSLNVSCLCKIIVFDSPIRHWSIYHLKAQ